MEPKLIGGRVPWPTGPPFWVYPLVPEALMTTDVFLPCSVAFGVPLGTGFAVRGPPCAICVADPFTGDTLTDFALCVGAETPAGAGGEGVAVIALA